MNIFSNVERNVESFSFNKKELKNIDYISESASSNTALRRIQMAEKAKKADESIAKKEEAERKSALYESITDGIANARRTENAIAYLPAKIKDGLFKDIMCEMFVKSLYLDDDFIYTHKAVIEGLMTDYIDNHGGYKLLENTIAKTNSEFLKEVKNICEETSKSIVKRKIKDCKECDEPEHIDFDMTDDEKEELDYSKGSIDVDKISELVKDKVLTVIKDEKTREEKNSELIEDIENDLKDNPEVTDEASLNAAFEKIIVEKSPIEESTLFGALLRNAYADYIAENVSIMSADKHNIDEDKEMSANYDINTTIDEINEYDDVDVENKEINMDLILTEAIVQYTLMEMLYTLKFENYSPENIRKLTQKMVNQPITEAAKSTNDNKTPNPYFELRKEFFAIFNKLRDDVDTEKNREKMKKFVEEAQADDEKKSAIDSLIKQACGQIDSTVEKNPDMKDRLTELKDWLENGCEDKEEDANKEKEDK